MAERDGKGRPAGGGDKREQRRERQAEALRRNLARRKAQSRGRPPGEAKTDTEPTKS